MEELSLSLIIHRKIVTIVHDKFKNVTLVIMKQKNVLSQSKRDKMQEWVPQDFKT